MNSWIFSSSQESVTVDLVSGWNPFDKYRVAIMRVVGGDLELGSVKLKVTNFCAPV
jgi:hypothetical protein